MGSAFSGQVVLGCTRKLAGMSHQVAFLYGSHCASVMASVMFEVKMTLLKRAIKQKCL